MDKERIRDEAEAFFEWPTHDKTHVTTTSMLIFTGVIAEMAAEEAVNYAKYIAAKSAADAERYRWLRDNAGAWEVCRDTGEWTRQSGEKYRPRVYFSAYSRAYGGLTLDEAVDAAMKGANA